MARKGIKRFEQVIAFVAEKEKSGEVLGWEVSGLEPAPEATLYVPIDAKLDSYPGEIDGIRIALESRTPEELDTMTSRIIEITYSKTTSNDLVLEVVKEACELMVRRLIELEADPLIFSGPGDEWEFKGMERGR